MVHVVKPATIYDVAKAAGVSHQTVTRYLRGFEGIRPATKERVRRALIDLEYRPNGAARQLRSQRSNRIGILAHRMEISGPGQFITGAARAAQSRGYLVDIASVDGDDDQSVEQALGMLLEHRVSGVFATSQTQIIHDALEKYPFDVPISLASNRTGSSLNDPVAAMPGVLAAAHLVELGHDRLGFVAGPAGWLGSLHSYNGFLAEAQRLGASVLWTAEGDWTAQSGWKIAHEAPISALGISAVGVANDSMAIGFISGMHSRGVKVPDDLSVTGVDNAPDSQFFLPALSTVSVDFSGSGAYLMMSLIATIEDGEQPQQSHLDMRLIPRASTRAHKSANIESFKSI